MCPSRWFTAISGFSSANAKRFGKTDADQQSARQSRPLRDRNRIDRLHKSRPASARCLPHHRNNGPQVLARSQFRNDSAIRLMRGDLRGNHVRQDLLARAHHRRARLIAGAFDAEDVASGIISC